MSREEKYMNRCLELARQGEGHTAPNPMVGSVIVCEEKIIGEGFHREFGGPHAEVHAINSVKDKSLLEKSTLYVNLEPCAHYGKTPPCAELIVSHRISRVVIGTVDPFAKVSGRGIEIMKNAGVEVTVGILEKECMEINRRFFTFHEKKRPYVILKWAQTLDGFIDSDRTSGKPAWISNELSRMLVHRQRTEEAAILVGTNTAVMDNPSLTVRAWSGRQPLRMAIDRQNRLPDTLTLKDGKIPTIIFTESDIESSHNLEFVRLNFNNPLPEQLLAFMYSRTIQSVIVEGGRQLLQSFIDDKLWDETFIYTGSCRFGKGIKAPAFDYQPQFSEMIDDTRLDHFYFDPTVKSIIKRRF